ncbi:protein-L-isoaspartate O-methyltransferase family protein [Actinoplanes sp. HUAS TT8]|uniref:protein-L-isoaspartate O-methyltransferase family protein n=1 Tax=Actinoplanes sp. HUAS TT8 TaxID=3447453 RepID=UPI003F51F7B3
MNLLRARKGEPVVRKNGETLHRSLSEGIRRELTSLDVRAGDRVLEIGTGSGYSGALLAQLCGPAGHVTSIDVNPDLIARASDIHQERGIDGVDCHVADGLDGYPPQAPYQRLVSWCTFARLPRAWPDQVAESGRIVACLPLVELPSITVIATIAVTNGMPRVQAMFSAGYVQSRAQAYDDVHMPHRWVDASFPGDERCWIGVGWRHRDGTGRGARDTLDRILTAGHTEPCPPGIDWDWDRFDPFTGTLDDPGLSMVHLPGRGRAIGHTSPTSAAMILVDGTILADAPRSASLTVLHAWLDRWQRAGRPGAADLTARLVPNTGPDCPGWDLRVSLPGVVPAARAAVPQPRSARSAPA